MKVITCASYYGSGSSALIDLVSEYKNVKSFGDYEIRILHDIDGVSDLEYHLTECPNRHNSGHALKRFEKLVNFYSKNFLVKRYERIFNGKFYAASKKYIENLKDFSYKGWWFYDLYDRGEKHYFLMQLLNHFLRVFTKRNSNILKRNTIYCPIIKKDDFYKFTQDYTHELLCSANSERLKYIVIDQLVSSQNTERIMKYFKDDVFVFIVDRDPRDVFLCEMLSWHENIVPHDPYDFCKWFKYIHSNPVIEDNKKIIRINFEDLIYDYDNVVSLVEKQTGLNSNDHFERFLKFNPKRSIVNTQIFKKTNKFADQIKIIECELKEYLFDFSKYEGRTICGVDTNNVKIF